jgi:hypothetical protein
MSVEPYASAIRVFWIVDNGSSHQGPHAVLRMRSTWPTAELVHLPVHASWLNQIEIYFSIVQRKVIKPGDFADLEELAARLLAFQDRYKRHCRTLRLALRPQVSRPPPRTARHSRTAGRMTPDVSTERATSFRDVSS